MKNDVEIRNAVRLQDGRFDCEINHPVFGWIPFTASPDDPEAHGRAIYQELDAKEKRGGI